MIELEEKKTGVHIVIDYFSATFPFICYEEDSEYSIIDDIILMTCDFLSIKKEDVEKCDYAMHRFEYQYRLSDHITLRLCGPDLKTGHKSCSIKLSGQGCREFEELATDRTWLDFLEFFIVRLNASPTRIDIAIDDYDGNNITFEEVKRKLDSGHFTTSFQDKDFIMHGSNNKGLSLQFGSHSSTQMLVIYEKLKEQRTKGIECIQDYWVRYEMRYRHEKAYNVCMNIINHGNSGFKEYIFGLLYSMLDIKADNNYGEDNIHKAKTDDNWQAFLDNVNKAKIEKYKIIKSSYETYLSWITPLVSFYLLDSLFYCSQDINSLNIKIYSLIITAIETIDKRKLKKLNDFLKEAGLNPVDILELETIKKKLKIQIEISELPF